MATTDLPSSDAHILYYCFKSSAPRADRTYLAFSFQGRQMSCAGMHKIIINITLHIGESMAQ